MFFCICRSLHQSHDYHVYHTQDEQHQKLVHNTGQDIFGVEAILNGTEKYFDHNIECHNNSNDAYKQEQANPHLSNRLSQHLHSHFHYSHRSCGELTPEEISNRIYLPYLSGHEIDVKYTPPKKILTNYDTNSMTKFDSNTSKRPADNNYIKKSFIEKPENDSDIVNCDQEDVQRKRKKDQSSPIDCGIVEIKAESDEPEFRDKDTPPLRTKSY